MSVARDIITPEVARTYGMPVCDKCGQAYIFDLHEPFASCHCHTSEWGSEGDPFRLMQSRLLTPLDARAYRVVLNWYEEPDPAADPTVTAIRHRAECPFGICMVYYQWNSWRWQFGGISGECKSVAEGKQIIWLRLLKNLSCILVSVE